MTKERQGFDINWAERLASYSGTDEFKRNFPELKEKLEQKTPEIKPEKRKVFLFIGIPGTGKSTIARMITEIHPSLVISTDWIFFDQLIDVIGDDYYKAYIYRRELAKHFLEKGYSVILDSNLRKEKDRQRIYQMAKEYQAKLVLINIDCPLEIAAKRRTFKGGGDPSFEERKQGLKRPLREIERPTKLDSQYAKIIPLNTTQPTEKLRNKLEKLLK